MERKHNMSSRVLILVLMEDALVQGRNGYPSGIYKVLILVLMEDALVLFYIKTWMPKSMVLILVLMEDALVQANNGDCRLQKRS